MINLTQLSPHRNTPSHAPDYTTGSIPLHFCRLAIPLIASDILQQLYNTIDALIIGRFASSTEFAAVGVASTVMNLFLFAIIGACTGVSILLAQSYGSGKRADFRSYHQAALLTGTALSLFASFVGIALLSQILAWIQTPTAILPFATCYLQIVLAGLVISYFYNLYAALLRSIGQAKIALLALFVAVITNLLLDLLFIPYLGMGIRGAALATVMAQSVSGVVCVVYLLIAQRDLLFFHTKSRLLPYTTNLFRVASVTSFHQVSLFFGKLLVQSSVNAAGTDLVLAYTATTRIEGFANAFGSSGSSATSILVAQNYGAKKERRVRATFWWSLGILFFLGAISSLLLRFSADFAIAILLGDGESLAFAEACQYLRTVALFYVFCFTGNTFTGFYGGKGLVKIPFIGTMSHMTLRVILSFLWVPLLGLSGVALATGLGWMGANLLWSLYYRGKIQQDF